MRVSFVIAVSILATAGCASAVRPSAPPVAVAPVPIAPFDDTPQSFVVPGKRFTPGEATIVKVCIAEDRSVTSAEIIESSGDRRFDQVAVQWARQVKIRSVADDDGAMDRCGAVRVEIRPAQQPRVMSGPDVSLG